METFFDDSLGQNVPIYSDSVSYFHQAHFNSYFVWTCIFKSDEYQSSHGNLEWYMGSINLLEIYFFRNIFGMLVFEVWNFNLTEPMGRLISFFGMSVFEGWIFNLTAQGGCLCHSPKFTALGSIRGGEPLTPGCAVYQHTDWWFSILDFNYPKNLTDLRID